MGTFKSSTKMKKLNSSINSLLVAIILISVPTLAAADFGTLFTTASERKVIDDNRYLEKRVKKIEKPKETSVAKIEIEEPQEIIYELISNDYKISGISISADGEDTAWINGKVYLHGDNIEKKTKISINSSQRKVRFTVRGGKTFYGTSGDTVTVSYRVPITE